MADKPGFFDFITAAFNARPFGMFVAPNWIGLGAFGLLGLMDPGFWVLGAGLELGYLLDLASCMLQAGIARTESRGAHSRPYDFPDRDDENFLKHSISRWNGDGPKLTYGDVRMTQWKPMERTY